MKRTRVIILLTFAIFCFWIPAQALSAASPVSHDILAKPTKKPTKTARPRYTATKVPSRTPVSALTSQPPGTSTLHPTFSPMPSSTAVFTGTITATATGTLLPPTNTVTVTGTRPTVTPVTFTVTAALPAALTSAPLTETVSVGATGTATQTYIDIAPFVSSQLTATLTAAGAPDVSSPPAGPSLLIHRSAAMDYLIVGIGLILISVFAFLLYVEMVKNQKKRD